MALFVKESFNVINLHRNHDNGNQVLSHKRNRTLTRNQRFRHCPRKYHTVQVHSNVEYSAAASAVNFTPTPSFPEDMSPLSGALDSLPSPVEFEPAALLSFLEQLPSKLAEFQPQDVLSKINEFTIGDLITQVQNQLAGVDLSSGNLTMVVQAAALAVGGWGLFNFLFVPSLPPVLAGTRAEPAYEGQPYEFKRGSYNPDAATAFFKERPGVVAKRGLTIWRATNVLALGLLWDWRTGQLEKNQKMRAAGILEIVTALGPTFIKIGQTLSIRPDIIPQAYADELVQLQDSVPPFSSSQARQILALELGLKDAEGALVGPRGVFKDLSQDPVAAASIGVVFRGTLSDGREVAVKVQRPDAFSQIALDLFLVRLSLPFNALLTGNPVDLELVDEWGLGFLNECDYLAEAQNSTNFSEAMRARGLDAVMSPEIVYEFSSSKVLVSEWVNGTRLDQSDAEDVPRLCSVALNAYLTMLLDTGCLHCDPHPGNLLRTTDGRLCILDWGMTQEVDTNVQYAMVEYIAHINSKNYDKIPQDFVNMGFLTADKMEEVRKSGFLEPLTYMLQQLAEGGGPKKVQERIIAEYKAKYPGLEGTELRAQMRLDMRTSMVSAQQRATGEVGMDTLGGEVDVSAVTKKFEELQKNNSNQFKLPPYFLYIARAFAVLEGIGLGVNEDFSIVKECWPYLAKRLLTDDSPRAEKALRDLIYGVAKSDSPNQSVDLSQMEELASGFTSFTATSSTPKGAQSDQGIKAVAEAAASVLLAEQETLLQKVVVTEAAGMATALTRQMARNFLEDRQKLADSLGPLGALLLPPLPTEITAFAAATSRDPQSLALAEKIAALSSAANSSNAAFRSTGSAASNPLETLLEVQRNLPDLQPYIPGTVATGGRFSAALLRQTAEDIEEVLRQEQAGSFVKPFASSSASIARQIEGRIQEALPRKSSVKALPPPSQ